MNAVRLSIPLPPPVTEVGKKITFYRAVAAVIFILAVIWLVTDFDITSSIFFLLLTFVSYKLYQSAEGNDFLKILVGSYILIDDDKFVLQPAHYAFDSGNEANATTILWPAARELRIGDYSFEVLFQSGQFRKVELDYLSSRDLELVKERLWEVKVKYNF
ncbi:hypothetical protein [Pontibacter ruber]|uniref:Uncharacterized protein n=1 Tax=Pontibacter ruber TaxID=1343895 RepID=A0ABW5CWI2_9BACT|nr:hypothetical protein [Pontibacter ruber]